MGSPDRQPAGQPWARSESRAPVIDDFLAAPTRELDAWRWLWSGDQPFPIRGRPGLLGRLAVAYRRLARPLVKRPLNDLWDRQRTFNLILIDHLERLGREADQFQARVLAHVESMAETVEKLEGYRVEGLDDVLRHNDALFALLDQKVDRYRRESQELWGRLAAAVAKAEDAPPASLARVRAEQEYLELERRFRGSESEIEERLARYLGYLEGRGEILDLGCGRGESLAVLCRHGIPARGVDASAEMVAACHEKGLPATEGDLFAALEAAPAASLGGVVSFHVIEHLPIDSLDRLVSMAWRALKAGGVLILETPNPLSLVVAARNFWLDPTHRRPIHPASLELTCRLAGFEPVERLQLRPFPAEERLPELPSDGVPRELREITDATGRLRDRLDALLFGYQDYAVVAFKPARG